MNSKFLAVSVIFLTICQIRSTSLLIYHTFTYLSVKFLEIKSTQLNGEFFFTVSPEPRYENDIIVYIFHTLKSYIQPYLYHSHLTTVGDRGIRIGYCQAMPTCCKWKEIFQFSAFLCSNLMEIVHVLPQ